MKLSGLLFPTLKEIPKDAVITSHILMLRAGMIRKLASGLYSFLPLGLMSFKKVENIIRREMNKAGAQEFSLPILTPAELWQESGRWEQFGPELVRIQDRHEIPFALGPTHEEVFTNIAKTEIFSYKQLPVTFYQIKTKFRDEIRPRFGVMRCREFTMKDAYSFDMDNTSLSASYLKMRTAYTDIFKACGLKIKTVLADSGSMGGAESEEFMVESEVGEDFIVTCPQCSYSSNLEKASSKYDYHKISEPEAPLQSVETPDVRTIEELTAFLKKKPTLFIKTLIYKHDKEHVAVLIRGDLEINEKKLLNALSGGTLELADASMVKKITNAPVGFAGPVGLKNIRIIADDSVRFIINGITGANEKDKHHINVNLDKDYKVDSFFDLRLLKEGDACPVCGAGLKISKGIEVGHVFKLGDKYTKSMGVSVLDQDGKAVTPIMGCYGIGVDRTLAAVVEQYNDADGIIFPVSVAPFSVVITPVDFNDKEQSAAALKIYDGLLKDDIDVLLDDRDLRPGVKFKDADLIGIPIRITIGPKFLKEDKIEIRLRHSKEVSIHPLDSAVVTVKNMIKKLLEEMN